MTRLEPFPEGRPSRRLRPPLRWGVVLAAAALAVVAPAGPASAAIDLESSTPGPSERLDEGPARVVLRFDELLLLNGVSIAVTGPDGDVTAGPTVPLGHVATQRLDGDLDRGRYTVRWRVADAVGRPGTGGTFTFRVGAAPPRPPKTDTPSARPEDPDAKPPAQAEPEPTAESRGEESEEASDEAREEAGGSRPAPSRTGLEPAVDTSDRTSELPVGQVAPTTQVPNPEVDGVSSAAEEWLPPPLFWWTVLVLVAAVLYAYVRVRRREEPDDLPRPEVATLGHDPTPPDGLQPATADRGRESAFRF